MVRIRKVALRIAIAVLVLAGVAFAYRTVMFRLASAREVSPSCSEGSSDAQAFEIAGTISNEFHPLSNPAPWCAPGLRGGRSTGDGTGTIGEFSFYEDWCLSDGALRAEDVTVATDEGEILMSEVTRPVGGPPGRIEALVRNSLGPPLEFEGVFTITGGTGRYEGAAGEANLVARQLGGGRTAFAACGTISY